MDCIVFFWSIASKISQQINRQISLSPKNFGYAKWPALIRATEYFEEGKNSKEQQVFRIKKKYPPKKTPSPNGV